MCGLAGRERTTFVVPDVRTDGCDIACSPMVRSEIVVALLDGGQGLGVLDVDSAHLDAFTAEDQALFATVASYLVATFRRDSTKSFAP